MLIPMLEAEPPTLANALLMSAIDALERLAVSTKIAAARSGFFSEFPQMVIAFSTVLAVTLTSEPEAIAALAICGKYCLILDTSAPA